MPVSVPLDVVKQFSPVLVFHPNKRFFPCSLEFLLAKSHLHYRNFGFPNPIAGQTSSSTPSITPFNGWLYMVYQDSKTFDIYVSRSQDSLAWHDTTRIPDVTGGGPSIIAFRDRLWLVWHSVLSSQLWIADSNDGLKWDNIRKIEGQHAWKTSLTVYKDELFMVYTDPANSHLWSTHSADGTKWDGTELVLGQFSAHASLTTFRDKIVMVYGDAERNKSQFFISEYDGNVWNWPRVIPGNTGTAPSVTTIGDDALFLTYYSDDSGTLHASTTPDGHKWGDPRVLPGQKGDIPSSCIMNNTVYIVYRQETHLYSTFCENGDLSMHAVIQTPTMHDLARYNSMSYYVHINTSQYPGQEIPLAPMYYAVQSKGSQILISYPILYADQGGQTIRVLRAGSEFNCIINTIGQHQGDLELFTVLLDPPATPTSQSTGGEYTLVECGFEQHGRLHIYPPLECKFEDKTHTIVHVALNGHSSHNADPAQNDGMILEFAAPGIVAVGSWIGKGKRWRAYKDESQFKRLGVDAEDKPVSDQVWAMFGGRLGDTVINRLTSATTLDGKDLDLFDWEYVKGMFKIADDLGIISRNFLVGDAPVGPRVRHWITTDVEIIESHSSSDSLPSDGEKVAQWDEGEQQPAYRS